MTDLSASFRVSHAKEEGSFTKTAANECMINETISILLNGVHSYWRIKVTDINGNTYEWRDYVTASDAAKGTMKTNIYDHLVSSVEMIPDDSESHHSKTESTITGKGNGERVGS
jgi:hypothetical protein